LDRLLAAPEEAERRAAQLARAESRLDDARNHLEAALALNPSFDDARLDLIELLLALNQIDDARAETERLSPQTVQSEPRYQAIKTRFLKVFPFAVGIISHQHMIRKNFTKRKIVKIGLR
ncbi:MAG: tetratricopeptide repeat protein, partial [Mucilaginibacter sp.]|nr:tetratricopeptide repeat protein [Mucilaginibacter sp.]